MVYVVERYLPGLSRSDLLRALSRLERAAGVASEVRYLGSTIVLDDEACFCQFEGPSVAAVADANRRAGLSFDRIVPAVDVQTERRSPMTLPTTVPARVVIRRSHLLGLVATVAALAAAVTWVLVSFAFDTRNGTRNGEAQRGTSASAAALVSLSPKERRYVLAISSLTPARLEAAFGTGPDAIDALGLSPADERYVRGISSLTPAQLQAAFGTGRAPRASLTLKQRQYLQSIASTAWRPPVAAHVGTSK